MLSTRARSILRSSAVLGLEYVGTCIAANMRVGPMIPKPLDAINAADILALVKNHEEEGRTIEFKRDLPGKTEKERQELLADISSFANASGGDLIFGVAESEGVATAVTALPGIDIDSEILRLEAVIRAGLDPRVPGVESRAIEVPGKGHVIVVRVPNSWRGPHFVKSNETFRMYGRHSKGKYPFDATEIRSAFALSEELPERIRRWRDDRLATIIGGDAPIYLHDGAKLIIHLVPILSFAKRVALSATEIASGIRWFPSLAGGIDHRYNIDGVVTFNGPLRDNQPSHSYCQVFRSGQLEAVLSEIVSSVHDKPMIASTWCEKEAMEAIDAYMVGMKALGLSLPIVVLMALSGAKGARLAVDAQLMGRHTHAIDRNMLLLPDVLVEAYDVEVDILLRPVFDAMWNAAGFARSFNYDANGIWKPHR